MFTAQHRIREVCGWQELVHLSTAGELLAKNLFSLLFQRKIKAYKQTQYFGFVFWLYLGYQLFFCKSNIQSGCLEQKPDETV